MKLISKKKIIFLKETRNPSNVNNNYILANQTDVTANTDVTFRRIGLLFHRQSSLSFPLFNYPDYLFPYDVTFCCIYTNIFVKYLVKNYGKSHMIVRVSKFRSAGHSQRIRKNF